MFSVWFWNIFALIFAMLISLPTAALIRIGKKLAVHQSLFAEQIEAIHTASLQLEPSDIGQIVDEFNNAAYLLKRPFVPRYSGPFLTVRLYSTIDYLELHLYGSEVDVVKVHRGRKIAYQIRSLELHARIERMVTLINSTPPEQNTL